MNKQLLLFLTKSLKFLVCLLLLDAGLGEIHRVIFFKQTSGKFYRINYTMDVSTENFLVFGSSHAAAHYVPEVFEKELGLTCYNAGVAGQQILIHETLQEILLERTRPKVMILDVDTYGFYNDMDQYARLSDLHPFYYKHSAIIGRVLALESRLTRYFLMSKLFQYNSTIIHILRYWLAPQADQKGYRATFAQLKEPVRLTADREGDRPSPVPMARPIDPKLMARLERFVANARKHDVLLSLAISPNLEQNSHADDAAVEQIQAIADKHNIKIFNFADDPAFIGRYELFADAGHLNDAGARLYSRMVAEKIKEEFPGLSR